MHNRDGRKEHKPDLMGVARQTWANGGSLQVNEVRSSNAVLAGAGGGGNGHWR